MCLSLYNSTRKPIKTSRNYGKRYFMYTRPWSARNADKNSLSLPVSRSFMPRRASPTSPSAAKSAAQSAKTPPTTAHARCMTQSAPNAERNAKFPLSPAPTVPSTAATASEINSSDPETKMISVLPHNRPAARRFFSRVRLTFFVPGDIIFAQYDQRKEYPLWNKNTKDHAYGSCFCFYRQL